MEQYKNEFRVYVLFSRGGTKSDFVREGRTGRRACAFKDILPSNDGESVNEFMILNN